MFPLTYVSTSASVTGSVEGISCHLEISGGQEKIRKIQTMEHAIVLERCRYVVFISTHPRTAQTSACNFPTAHL